MGVGVQFLEVVAAEVLKLRRSRVPGATVAVAVLLVALVGLFFWIARNPGAAETLGLLGRKATLALEGQALDGPYFFLLAGVVAGLGGMLLSAVIVIFVFGREYTDGTAKVLHTLPVPRWWFVAAKFAVSSLWFFSLTVAEWAAAWAVGSFLGLPGLTGGLLTDLGLRLGGLFLLAFGCSSLPAWIAVATRGYFAPLGFAVFTLVLASVFGHTGWAPWVPWSIVGIATGISSPETILGWPNFAVVAATFVLGAGLTVHREASADNQQ